MLRIGCDIGGVVRDLATGEPVAGALDGLAQLRSVHHVCFISKCGQNFKELSLSWLADRGLAGVPIHFCEADEGKAAIAQEQGIDIMIDDRIQVLRCYPDSITKIWLCNEDKKIAGTRKHQPELFQALQLARTWQDIISVVQDRASG